MHAKITFNNNLSASLRYHERKLESGKAECVLAENFIKDLHELTSKDKAYHFQRLNSLNQLVEKKMIHISLNFHPGDQLSNRDMHEIAKAYMEKMGMGGQPYLVYRHYDAPHPHAHVLSNLIQHDGKSLRMPPKAFHLSARISREMEASRNLAPNRKNKVREPALPNQAVKVIYGQHPVLPAISRVLDKVIEGYKCTSLEELNAVLQLYNVKAYRGQPGSFLHRSKGLYYQVLDEQGRLRGVPIKASEFDIKPTLGRLERQFALNLADRKRQEHRQRVTVAIDWALLNRLDKAGLQKTLERERISMVWMQEGKGSEKHIFYMDHQTKAVFDGRQLGERYSTKGLGQRCAITPLPVRQMQQQKQKYRNDLSLEL